MLTWVTYTTETCCQDYLDLPLPPFGLLGRRGRPYKADHPDWGPSGFDHNGKQDSFKTQGFREWWCLKCSKPAAQAVENHATY